MGAIREPISAASGAGPEVEHPRGGLGGPEVSATISRGRVRLERDRSRAVSFSPAQRTTVRFNRLTRKFDAQEMVPSASTSSGAAAIARSEESDAEAFECFFRRPSVVRFGAVALRATVETSAWSLATLPRVA